MWVSGWCRKRFRQLCGAKGIRDAPSGNRTRGISLATRYFTTKPTALRTTRTGRSSTHAEVTPPRTNNARHTRAHTTYLTPAVSIGGSCLRTTRLRLCSALIRHRAFLQPQRRMRRFRHKVSAHRCPPDYHRRCRAKLVVCVRTCTHSSP